MFRVPPHMIADLDRATFSNIEHQSLEFVLHTMTPWAERWESSIESSLLLESEEDLEIEFDFTSLLRGDHSARAAYYNSGINTGWLTRNEARLMEGYDPLKGLDQPLQPLNMVPAGTLPKDPATVKNDPGKLPAPTPDARRAALVRGIADRLARRAVGGLQKAPGALADVFSPAFAAVVAESLAIGADEAQAFCAWAVANLQEGTLWAEMESTLSQKLCDLGQ